MSRILLLVGGGAAERELAFSVAEALGYTPIYIDGRHEALVVCTAMWPKPDCILVDTAFKDPVNCEAFVRSLRARRVMESIALIAWSDKNLLDEAKKLKAEGFTHYIGIKSDTVALQATIGMLSPQVAAA